MLKNLAAAIVLAVACAGAHAAPASTESIERLLVLAKSEKLMDSIYADVEGFMRQAMKQAVGNRRLTPEQERALAVVPSRYATALRAEMSWESFKPDLVKLYQELFTQEDIDAQIAFYNTPAGQSMIDKMPELARRSMGMAQARMQAMAPRLLRVIEDALNEAGVMTR